MNPLKVTLITTGQPSTNPRLVKEADALQELGYHVKVFYSFWDTWASDADIDLLREKVWNYQLIGGSPFSSRIIYHKTRIRKKIASTLLQKLGKLNFAPYTFTRNYSELLQVAYTNKADLFIAHNLGALPVAAKAAAHHQTHYAFDAEDYHRGQLKNMEGILFNAIKHLEDKYLPSASYITAASPLISKHYQAHYPQSSVTTINNVFSKKSQKPFRPLTASGPLKLFWFSQTVGPNRGLEEAIMALAKLADKNIILNLLGKCSTEHREYFNNLISENGLSKNCVVFHPPISPKQVFEKANEHHIGLALELPNVLNREICLTNKIFTYLIAGNAVVASETLAQKQFMYQYPTVGKSFALKDVDKLTEILSYFYDNRAALEACRLASWELANQEKNWEMESERFLVKVKDVIG